MYLRIEATHALLAKQQEGAGTGVILGVPPPRTPANHPGPPHRPGGTTLLFGGMVRLSVLLLSAAVASQSARVSAWQARAGQVRVGGAHSVQLLGCNATPAGRRMAFARVDCCLLCPHWQLRLLETLTKGHGVSDGPVADQDGSGNWVGRAVGHRQLLPRPGKGGCLEDLRLRAEAQVGRPPNLGSLVPGHVRASGQHLHYQAGSLVGCERPADVPLESRAALRPAIAF